MIGHSDSTWLSIYYYEKLKCNTYCSEILLPLNVSTLCASLLDTEIQVQWSVAQHEVLLRLYTLSLTHDCFICDSFQDVILRFSHHEQLAFINYILYYVTRSSIFWTVDFKKKSIHALSNLEKDFPRNTIS